MSEQDTKTDEVEGQQGAAEAEDNQRQEDPIGDLSELEKIKKELEAEKAKAAKELQEGED